MRVVQVSRTPAGGYAFRFAVLEKGVFVSNPMSFAVRNLILCIKSLRHGVGRVSYRSRANLTAGVWYECDLLPPWRHG